MAKIIPYREERRLMKKIHELNQNLKKFYSVYNIGATGVVRGVPVKNKEGYVDKTEYYNSCYYAGVDVDSDIILSSDMIYKAFSNSKPTNLVKDKNENRVYLLDAEKDEKFLVGIISTPEEIVSKIISSNTGLATDIYNMVNNPECIYEFSEEEIRKLINYEKLSVNIDNDVDNISYRADLSIGLFPLLKKFKNLKAYMKTITHDMFTVLFESSDGSDRAFILYKFMKL